MMTGRYPFYQPQHGRRFSVHLLLNGLAGGSLAGNLRLFRREVAREPGSPPSVYCSNGRPHLTSRVAWSIADLARMPCSRRAAWRRSVFPTGWQGNSLKKEPRPGAGFIMRILLIMPDAHMHKLRLGSFVRSMREAPLTLTTLAALVPPPGVEVKLVDGSVDGFRWTNPADLVGISVITGCARPAYALARHFRRRGIPVVLGGVHVTILPGEAIQHADSIVIGRGESAWPRLIEDFRRGRLKRVYREHPCRTMCWPRCPLPRRDLQRRSGYMLPNTVQATRGCRRTCDFCTVNAVWPRYLKRPVADVVRDVRSIQGGHFGFNDVSLVDDAEYARELFTAIAPLRKKWGGLVTADSLQNTELLDLMVRSGCVYLLVGFESGDQATLQGIRKNFNKTLRYKT